MPTYINFLHPVLLFALLSVTPIVNALDTSAEEVACKDIGFKTGTEAFGGCVLELMERNTSSSVAAQPQGDGSEDDRLCQQYGFIPGENNYSDCRLQITIAKEKALAEQKRYELELAEYNREVAIQKEKKDFAINMGILAGGLCLMSGDCGNTNSQPTTSTLQPPPAPANMSQDIRLPDGSLMRCTTVGNQTRCR